MSGTLMGPRRGRVQCGERGPRFVCGRSHSLVPSTGLTKPFIELLKLIMDGVIPIPLFFQACDSLVQNTYKNYKERSPGDMEQVFAFNFV